MNEKSTWDIANQHCNKISIESSLAVVESKKVYDFLMNEIKFRYPDIEIVSFWIGLREVNGRLSWIDTDQYWMPNEFEDISDNHPVSLSWVNWNIWYL